MIALVFSLVCLNTKKVFCQHWQIHLNGNETYITGNDLQGYYPILWYSSNDDRGVLVGGFGAGVSYTSAQRGIYQIKYQFNAQRSRFYDHPAIFTDENGEPLGGFIGINTNLNASAMVVPQIVFSNRLSAGLGLGTRYTFYAITDLGETFIRGEKVKLKQRNNSIRPLGLFVPLEITGTLGRFGLTARIEPALTNFSRVEYFKGDRASLFYVEFSYRISSVTE